ncbi:uncharacterized membrane protein YgaE (UPF0421/DUF939 family) [Sphingomonas leidyi]|jgi:hypothetical protein|uniref:Uncharacterized membrane protein YgaE (UPF0421/DUF939 family) n=2 Tax=Sphingomonadaceae TaxID=41297 RepID=A0A7X5V277_9SPHN|nr:hypothetical protein [Sphingomonas sp.]MDF2385016.1 hypothetical protein [Nostoc ellipsosporum NOK]NIJ66443.1 uncharacterized membrane protein YgaE (UPF0421/DUF939 family) [Sphingomonas leidyi]OJY54613.1 MAG: hypothetical protein BGP17_06220 [Sphingomonas sp. 67-41]OSZ65017.1 hypothetical protein CAP40_14465 [Sphingomonas sp. IBVSS2]
MNVLVYLVVLLLCCLYAVTRGGLPERLAVLILVLAIVASHFAPVSGQYRFQKMEVGLLAVDSGMFLSTMLLSLRAQRYWPMWLSAVYLNIVVTHLLMLTPSLMPWSYAVANAAWNYPGPLLIAIGAARHRQRLKRYGADPAWS